MGWDAISGWDAIDGGVWKYSSEKEGGSKNEDKITEVFGYKGRFREVGMGIT